MTASQKIQIKLSEHRQKLNTLLGVETRDEAQQTELERLTGEVQALEPKLRAALAAEPDPQTKTTDTTGDPEARERIEIRSRTGLGEFLHAAVTGAEVHGAAAEYAAACKVPAAGHVPMAIFRDRQPETRAITAGPAVDGPPQPTVPFVFERSAAASLGILMPMVPAGQVQIPRITAATPADTLAKDAAAPSSAATVALDSRSPVRIAGSFEVRVEDLAVWPALEDELGTTMQGAVCERARRGDVQRRGGRAERAVHAGVGTWPRPATSRPTPPASAASRRWWTASTRTRWRTSAR